MGQCKLCGKKGLFLSLSKNGLCDGCEKFFVLDLNNRTRIVGDCLRLIKTSKNLDTRLSRCDLLEEQAKVLLEYQRKGIPIPGGVNPSDYYLNCKAIREEILKEKAESERLRKVCPYCGKHLEDVVKGKKKCPSCGEFIYVRTRPSDRQRVLVTEEGAKQIEEEWERIRIQKAEDIKKEIVANSKATLEGYKASGVVSKIEVSPAPDCCPACRAIAGIYPLEQAPELPYKGCTSPKGCRCCYLPVVD